MQEAILTVKEAAELLRVSSKTMYDWVHIPGFPALRVGNIIRIRKDLLLEWVENRIRKEMEAAE